MAMHGRTYNFGDYRYGFNGKEKDDELKGLGNSYDYGFRVYNPQIAKFLSVDPLSPSYPELTPYQYASNRPIDGIDIDGLEYGTYKINIDKSTGKVTLSNYIPYNKSQHNAHGPLGRGIIYEINGKSIWYPRNKKALGILPVEYGNYYGETGLYEINNQGNFSKKYDYSNMPPVDAVDAGAMHHDKHYDLIDAVGPKSFNYDWGTIPADLEAVKTWQQVIDIGVGGIDPFNEQRISEDAISAARGGVYIFNVSISGKKCHMSEWMYKNYREISKNPHEVKNGFWDIANYLGIGYNEENVEYNYQQFMNIYMEQTDQGMKRKEGMWKKDRAIYVPIAPSK